MNNTGISYLALHFFFHFIILWITFGHCVVHFPQPLFRTSNLHFQLRYLKDCHTPFWGACLYIYLSMSYEDRSHACKPACSCLCTWFCSQWPEVTSGQPCIWLLLMVWCDNPFCYNNTLWLKQIFNELSTLWFIYFKDPCHEFKNW